MSDLPAVERLQDLAEVCLLVVPGLGEPRGGKGMTALKVGHVLHLLLVHVALASRLQRNGKIIGGVRFLLSVVPGLGKPWDGKGMPALKVSHVLHLLPLHVALASGLQRNGRLLGNFRFLVVVVGLAMVHAIHTLHLQLARVAVAFGLRRNRGPLGGARLLLVVLSLAAIIGARVDVVAARQLDCPRVDDVAARPLHLLTARLQLGLGLVIHLAPVAYRADPGPVCLL
mmetsp:Transcript_34943/g.108729  ORF Transcript_34943/g.108729 Transcript_34943/m.108729 type:complete len:228 (-) Transcript_34943:535-1218(-)